MTQQLARTLRRARAAVDLVRPESFDEDLSEEWDRWVLAHGLPDIDRTHLVLGESVPVAYWIGPRTAAVLHIRFLDQTEDDDDYDDEEPFVETDATLYFQVDGEWEMGLGGGGSWGNDSPLARRTGLEAPLVPHGVIGWDGNDGCKAVLGEIAADAAYLEVEQGGDVTRRPVEG